MNPAFQIADGSADFRLHAPAKVGGNFGGMIWLSDSAGNFLRGSYALSSKDAQFSIFF